MVAESKSLERQSNNGALEKKAPQMTLKDLLISKQAEMQKMAGSYVDAGRLINVALLSRSESEWLSKCSVQSFISATMAAARLGIEPDGVHGALVPFKGTCTFIPMVQGYLRAIYEDPDVQKVEVRVAREGDEFRVELGTEDRIVHTPKLGAGERRPIAYYAVIKMRGGTKFDFMEPWEIEKIRARSSAVKSGKTTPWDTDYDEMAKKTVIRRMRKTAGIRSKRLDAMVDHERQTERQAESGVVDMPRDEPTHTTVVARTSRTQDLKRALVGTETDGPPYEDGDPMDDTRKATPQQVDEVNAYLTKLGATTPKSRSELLGEVLRDATIEKVSELSFDQADLAIFELRDRASEPAKAEG